MELASIANIAKFANKVTTQRKIIKSFKYRDLKYEKKLECRNAEKIK